MGKDPKLNVIFHLIRTWLGNYFVECDHNLRPKDTVIVSFKCPQEFEKAKLINCLAKSWNGGSELPSGYWILCNPCRKAYHKWSQSNE